MRRKKITTYAKEISNQSGESFDVNLLCHFGALHFPAEDFIFNWPKKQSVFNFIFFYQQGFTKENYAYLIFIIFFFIVDWDCEWYYLYEFSSVTLNVASFHNTYASLTSHRR